VLSSCKCWSCDLSYRLKFTLCYANSPLIQFVCVCVCVRVTTMFVQMLLDSEIVTANSLFDFTHLQFMPLLQASHSPKVVQIKCAQGIPGYYIHV